MEYLINKKAIERNIRCLVESEFYYILYNNLVRDNDDINRKEAINALIFNSIFISCQLLDNLDCIKKLTEDLCFNNKFSNTGMLEYYDHDFLLMMIKKYDNTYSEENLFERLKHGFAVHFTTTNIMDKIQNSGSLNAHEGMFSKDIEKKIFDAGKLQLENKPDAMNNGEFLSLGFGSSKGLSMSSQTVGYWMNHTPESLSFLFGGNVYTRNKEAAMNHVSRSISELSDSDKKEIYDLLSNLWDELVGNDYRLGAVLIDRDALEYETVTYYHEEPPLVEQIRPYRDMDFSSFVSSEDSRYDKNIPLDGLVFLKVPSISLLEQYRNKHKYSDEEEYIRKSGR